MEKTKEAANKYSMCSLNCDTECDTFETEDEKMPCCNRLQRKAFIDAVAWAERWIPVTEWYPEPYLTILVRGTIIHSSEVDIHITTCAWLAYDDDMKPIFTIQGSNEIINNVTHWRPIEHK